MPNPSCEPLRYGVNDLAKMILPLLPARVRTRYAGGVSALADVLRKTYEKGGLNSPDQKIGGETDYEDITRAEAYNFIVNYYECDVPNKCGVPHNELTNALTKYIPPGKNRPILESIYFFQASLFGEPRRRTQRPVEISVTHVNDGDTVRVDVKKVGCEDESMGIRFAGIDTPEKFRSKEKFWPQVAAIMNLWKDKGLITQADIQRNGPIETLLASRMEFAGAISSLIMKDFIEWANTHSAKYQLEDTYNRKKDPHDLRELCDMASLYDRYMRGIGVLRVEDGRMLRVYITTRLVPLMKNEGMTLWGEYQKKALEVWQRNRRVLYEFMNPDQTPRPSEMYSQEAVGRMEELWNEVVQKHPDRIGDINLMMAVVGAAYVYTKYLNNLSDLYMEAGRPVQKERLGLWVDELVQILDPNAHVLNKKTRRFEEFTIPIDCLKP